MVVIATAPAAFIPKNTCTAYHLVIPGDPIPMLSSSQRMLDNKDKSVKILPPHLDGSHPHDPQGLSYQHEIYNILYKQLKI
jgi:hypothetical protein